MSYSNTPYSVRMWENVDENNSEYGYFSRSVNHSRPQNSKVFEYGFSLKKIIFYFFNDSQKLCL